MLCMSQLLAAGRFVRSLAALLIYTPVETSSIWKILDVCLFVLVWCNNSAHFYVFIPKVPRLRMNKVPVFIMQTADVLTGCGSVSVSCWSSSNIWPKGVHAKLDFPSRELIEAKRLMYFSYSIIMLNKTYVFQSVFYLCYKRNKKKSADVLICIIYTHVPTVTFKNTLKKNIYNKMYIQFGLLELKKNLHWTESNT